MLDEIDKRYFLMVHEAGTIGHISDSDISVSCPICREGKSWKRKHRLHLYIKSSYDSSSIACFNCGYKGNMYSYLREYYPNEYVLYSKEKRSNSFDSLVKEDKPSYDIKEVIDTTFDLSSLKNECIPNLIDPIEFSDIPEEALDYLKSRGIEPLESWRYSSKNNSIVFNGSNLTLSEYIIVPLEYKDKWYGFQAIAWRKKKFFVLLVKGNDGFKVWNYFNIDKSKKVYIFESIFDAISSGLDNVIAVLGSNISEERLLELKDPVFCLDNQRIDEKSLKESIKYANNGYEIFVWPKGSNKFKDTNDLRKLNVPKDKISNMIRSNIFKGMDAVLRLKLI